MKLITINYRIWDAVTRNQSLNYEHLIGVFSDICRLKAADYVNSSEIIEFRSQVTQAQYKARFKRRTLHVLNLIIRFGTCKVRRLNQLGSADCIWVNLPFYSTGLVE